MSEVIQFSTTTFVGTHVVVSLSLRLPAHPEKLFDVACELEPTNFSKSRSLTEARLSTGLTTSVGQLRDLFLNLRRYAKEEAKLYHQSLIRTSPVGQRAPSHPM